MTLALDAVMTSRLDLNAQGKEDPIQLGQLNQSDRIESINQINQKFILYETTVADHIMMVCWRFLLATIACLVEHTKRLMLMSLVAFYAPK